jgi:glycosyltransferase involved in cell wall biosynthesis
MVIAADIHVPQKKSTARQDGAVYKSLLVLAAMYPQHQFVFIFSRPLADNTVFGKNIIPVIAAPKVGGRLLQFFWYNYKLPSLLSKYKADVFLGINGWCSMSVKLPQCLLVSDAVFSQNSPRFLKKQFPLFLRTAAAIIATSEHCRTQVIAACPAAAAKTQVIYPALGEEFAPASWPEKELVKEQHTGGREYFLHGAAITSQSQFIHLLKAWSLFKKRQKSSMPLLLTGDTGLPVSKLKEILNNYKYRDEVKLTGYLPPHTFAHLLAGAYALVHTGTGTQLPAEAMGCGVPVMADDSLPLREICGEAAVYFDAANPAAIAEQLMWLFKDESLLNSLAEKGLQRARPFRGQVAAVKLADVILQAGNL